MDETDNLVLRHLQEIRSDIAKFRTEVRVDIENFRAEVGPRLMAVDLSLRDLRALSVKTLGELVTFSERLRVVEEEVARLKKLVPGWEGV